MKRIFGLECEYGLTFSPNGRVYLPIEKILGYIFEGLIPNSWPSNAFLTNGARFYQDTGCHPEYATPECDDIFELVVHEKAGERILESCLPAAEERLREEGLAAVIYIFKNNTDSLGNTYGCHENFLMQRDVDFWQVAEQLIPFFVTRQIYSGAGKVLKVSGNPHYFLSQRAQHIHEKTSSSTTSSRSIINTRDEPLADWGLYRRLHLLVGDSNMMEYATALKVGTTALVLQLLEEQERVICDDIKLLDPVQAIRDISRDMTYRWEVQLEDGRYTTATEIQRAYLDLAERHLRGRDEEGDWVLDEWRFVIDALEHDPGCLVDRVDWVAKKWLLEYFMREEGLDWQDTWIQSLDLEYHNLNATRSLYFDLYERGMVKRVVSDEQINQAITHPPDNTRACARSRVMRALTDQKTRYQIDWDSICVGDDKFLSLDDPFLTYGREAEIFIRECRQMPIDKF